MPVEKIHNVTQLIQEFNKTHPGSYYFSKNTLKGFGERVSDMYLLKGTHRLIDSDGYEYECYVLSSLQRNNPAGPSRRYHYFEVDTLDSILI